MQRLEWPQISGLNGGLRAVYFYPQSTLLSWRILRVQLDMIDKITRFGTGIMLGAFAVIILTTTFSTADWVATLGKVILGDHMYCAALTLRLGRA